MTLAPTEALIGRARELGLLGGLIRELIGGAAATVLVKGEAGIGKTRLLTSALEAARASGVTVFRGEAHPLERTRPFGALVDALQLRGGSSDPRRAAIGRLLAAEATIGPDSPPAGALQFRVVEEIIDLLEVLSNQGPVLVALDDLHWADGSTLLTFRWMARQLTEVPVLLIATLRPSPRTAELDLLLDDCGRSGAELVALEALEQPDVDALVQAELEPQRRREVLEQGKLVPQCHRLQDEAVLVDEPEPGERLRERGATPDRRGSGSLPGIRSLCEHRW